MVNETFENQNQPTDEEIAEAVDALENQEGANEPVEEEE